METVGHTHPRQVHISHSDWLHLGTDQRISKAVNFHNINKLHS
uniref:Uncharacterized protein n=1 Tax=Anguilla anguilla TaxID=7936 RepID=A0A0E9QSG1_ANGAN